MTNQTLIKKDLTTEDLKFTDVIVSNVSTFPSKSGTQLINIQLVGAKKHSVFPGFLYFGSLSFEQLDELRGQKVNVLLASSSRGLNVKEVYAM